MPDDRTARERLDELQAALRELDDEQHGSPGEVVDMLEFLRAKVARERERAGA